MAQDAHCLLAQLRREALLIASRELGKPLTGLSAACKPLALSPKWRRKLRLWDAALGLVEKISCESIAVAIDELKAEIQACRGKLGEDLKTAEVAVGAVPAHGAGPSGPIGVASRAEPDDLGPAEVTGCAAPARGAGPDRPISVDDRVVGVDVDDTAFARGAVPVFHTLGEPDIKAETDGSPPAGGGNPLNVAPLWPGGPTAEEYRRAYNTDPDELFNYPGVHNGTWWFEERGAVGMMACLRLKGWRSSFREGRLPMKGKGR